MVFIDRYEKGSNLTKLRFIQNQSTRINDRKQLKFDRSYIGLDFDGKKKLQKPAIFLRGQEIQKKLTCNGNGCKQYAFSN